MDYGGKRNDVVDSGGEVDYAGFQWFQNAPPKPEPEPQVAPYVPNPAVIEDNYKFEYALHAASNVLYAQYRQYGQLGALSWCAEFGELIDNLRELGMQGNMFITTRKRALECCEEVMKLLSSELEIQMQIIVMYVCSQIQRLRRFLDSEGHWEDYPDFNFPIDTKSYPPPTSPFGAEHD
ncbi:hypothetical protein BDN72DRAFT_953748 [Pluteus cervinus]|uniref:Uncharacterized protein n=1 Tax=Pluteus cervinus TaxID=181527 RepID=A0ACD3BGP6_9AGAR|nr:hypothetical protein BDN72DRAFT_953748 [Pluteus cervinus]